VRARVALDARSSYFLTGKQDGAERGIVAARRHGHDVQAQYGEPG
jgi:hypothetical protein